jgi:circadian clock protein KaiC
MANVAFPRIESGIPGLDEMIEGGFPFPSVILVAGSAGSGKTTFAQRFLFA